MRAELRFDAVLFDLLTALLDSWALWNEVAGSAEAGRKWRAEYLRRTYQSGRYRPYETLVAEAATAMGLKQGLVEELAARYSELKPWPEVHEILGALRRDRVALGVVTNCSEELGLKAVACTGVEFDVVVTAERAGHYKPDPLRDGARRASRNAQPMSIRCRLRLRPVWRGPARSPDLLA